VDAPPPSLLEAVLEIADSVMTYKRQYFAAPHLAGVLALLLRDESNPRSLAFQLSVVLEHVHALDVDAHAVSTETERNLIDTLAEAIHTANFEDRPSGTLEPILQLLKAWIATLFALSDEITNRYFSHSTPRIS
jgi:uncharacterized alpha-E superfamily protein